jgi:hypothetical protein
MPTARLYDGPLHGESLAVRWPAPFWLHAYAPEEVTVPLTEQAWAAVPMQVPMPDILVYERAPGQDRWAPVVWYRYVGRRP